MLTLLIVTIPVEIIFLTILDILGWLNLPLLFVTFSIVFFACAVSFLHKSSCIKTYLLINNWLGIRITCHCPSPYKLPLVQGLRSRYVCTPCSFGSNGSYRTTTTRPMFWNCVCPWRQSEDKTWLTLITQIIIMVWYINYNVCHGSFCLDAYTRM